uniref:large ribosomal subunit protein bL9m n=1 Tax=Myxine glutinosa TaxID=7769 RepID=UPI00358F1D94
MAFAALFRSLRIVQPLSSCSRGVVVVERWWEPRLAKLGRKPRIEDRDRIYFVAHDTKWDPPKYLEVILMQSVEKLGDRGDVVTVRRRLARNKLFPSGLAVYASPENKLYYQAKEGDVQTSTGKKTVEFLKHCHFEVCMRKKNVEWELTKEIVCRQFFRQLGVVVPPHTLRLPDESVTTYGESWCEVTVNGLDSVRIPLHVVDTLSSDRRDLLKRQSHLKALAARKAKEAQKISERGSDGELVEIFEDDRQNKKEEWEHDNLDLAIGSEDVKEKY